MIPPFKTYITEQNFAAVRLTGILGAALVPSGVFLDVLTNPDRTREFLLLRLGASALVIGVMALSRLPALRRYSYPLGAAVILLCAIVIEVMTARISAATCPYYAGLNLCTLGAGLAFVWSGRQSLSVCLMILGMWLVPALWSHPTLHGPFFNNLYFLLLTGVIAVAANATRYNLAQREYEARMALAQASSELQTSLERIRELDRLKSQFFANISHELRTPLTLITAPTQELLQRPLRSEQQEAVRGTLQVILRNALRLHGLIDGLLDLAQLEAGRLRLRISPLELPALVEEVVASFQPAADTMGLKLRLEVSNQGEVAVLGDADKLEVVLTNLLGNAIKFTERGGTIFVRLRYDQDQAELTVLDNGPGIPVKDQPHIFDRFRRVESPGRKQGGAGIGLALVKELVELHGGTVAVRSRPGEGACFTVRLPVGGDHLRDDLDSRVPETLGPARTNPALLHVNDSLDSKRQIVLPPAKDLDDGLTPPPTPLEIFPHRGPSRARLLIAEDSSDLRRFLCDLLSPLYKVEAVADGQAALESMRRQPPDLLVSDVMMPHLSGIELCLQIKSDVRTRAVPVILLTARGGVEETLEGFAHGADDYLVKPFNPRELLMRVAVQLKLRLLTAQVANAARLAAVGTLAAGVAHEIKNPLNAINTGAVALRRKLDGRSGSTGEVLEMMQECCSRISDIATALTDHARPADGEGLSFCDLQKGLESTLRLLGERLRVGGVEAVRSYKTCNTVLGRPRQLNQVFLNLLDNALRASPCGGHIYVTLSDVGEQYVCLRVRDEGPGISREDQEHIFDPFFTTRPAGEGTGLGLYLSRQIVDAHGGTLRVFSEPGHGAEFQVELPRRVSHAEHPDLHGAAA